MPIAMDRPTQPTPMMPPRVVMPEMVPEVRDLESSFSGNDLEIHTNCPELLCPDVECPPCRVVTCSQPKVVTCPPPRVSTSTKVVVRPTTVREAVIQYRTVVSTTTEISTLGPEWCDPRPISCPPLSFACPDPEPFDCSDCPRAAPVICPTSQPKRMTCPPPLTPRSCDPCPKMETVTVWRDVPVPVSSLTTSPPVVPAVTCPPCPEMRRVTLIRTLAPTTVSASVDTRQSTTCPPVISTTSTVSTVSTAASLAHVPTSTSSRQTEAGFLASLSTTCPPPRECQVETLTHNLVLVGAGAAGMLFFVFLFGCLWYGVRKCRTKRRMRRAVYRNRCLDEAGERLSIKLP